jgi:uncharacterized cupin superfamily protein
MSESEKTMSRPILNIADVELKEWMPVPEAVQERFGARFGQIGPALGAQKLGYNLTVIEPGKRAFPFHNHRVNEEMFFIIEGTGELRVGSETHPIRGGDVIACPPGGQETAHQIHNTGASEMRVLAVSTRLWPEICDYPDSGKFGVLSMTPGVDGKPEIFRHMARPGTGLDYWDGE